MKEYEIDLKGLSVCIGIPSTRAMHVLTVKSLFATQTLCMELGIPCSLAIVAGNAVVQWARDEVLDLFLQSKANKLFMIDSDIVWEPEDFMRLLALSQRHDIVCATYPAKQEPLNFYIRYDESKPLEVNQYGLVDIMGAGLGFTVVARNVIEHISKVSDKIYDEISKSSIPSIFEFKSFEGKRRGEDMIFFEKLIDLGYKVYLDPSIELGHIGTKVYKGRILDVLKVVS